MVHSTMVSRLAVLSTMLLSFAAAQETVPENPAAINATLPAQTGVQTGVLLPNPDSPTCEVGIAAELTNGSLALQDPAQPTASPVPSLVSGQLSLQLANLQTTDLQGPFTVTVEVPYGTAVSNISGAVGGQPTVGSNGTLAINFTVSGSLPANAAGYTFVNTSILASSQDFSPRTVAINGRTCAIGLKPNITAPVALPDASSSPSNLSAFLQAGYININGNRLVGVDGNLVTLNGANWFGFETQATMVDGLYAGDSSLTVDFATVAYRIQLLGFNAIRLPFSFLNLFQNMPTSYTRSCAISSQADIRANVIDPRDAPNIPANSQPPSIVAPPSTYGISGICNDYIPNDSIYTRFLYVVGYLARQGFYILIDNHANTDPTVVNNPATWVAQWTQLMRDITADAPSKARVMVDILNEPDSRGLTWADMRTNYLNVMDAVYQFSPTTLFFIEGMRQSPIQMCWGDGFVTDGALIAQYGLSDPRPFFNDLLQRPYLNNVVISPHYYGPSVSQSTSNYTGAGLAYRASASFGTLATTGYGGHIFPIVIGETGTQLIDPRDLDFYRDFSLYLNNEGYEADGQHAVIHDLFWWSWNSNSGDTGGLVDTTWVNVIWNKTEYLEITIGLTPWSLLAAQGATPASTPAVTTAPTPTPTSTPNPTTLATPTPTTPATPTPTTPATPMPTSPATPTPTSPATPTPTTPATPVPTTTPVPTATPTPTATSAPVTPTGGQACAATFSVDSTWESGGISYAVFSLYLSNTGTSAVVTPYTITLTNPGYTGAPSSWNWQASYASGVISGATAADQTWETLLPGSQNSVNVGGILSNSLGNANLRPSSVTVAGVQCSLQ